MSEDDERSLVRPAFNSIADDWRARHTSLDSMLRDLEDAWPHLFALPAAKLTRKDGHAPRPWVPADQSEREIERAYKRATVYLHPDRLTGRDVSVCVEAEEVLKVLTRAHADRTNWQHGLPILNGF